MWDDEGARGLPVACDRSPFVPLKPRHLMQDVERWNKGEISNEGGLIQQVDRWNVEVRVQGGGRFLIAECSRHHDGSLVRPISPGAGWWPGSVERRRGWRSPKGDR